MAQETTGIAKIFGDLFAGASASVGLNREEKIDSMAKVVGANLPGLTGGMFIQGALTRSALKKLDKPEVANQVVSNIPLGSFTVRAI